MRLCFGSLCDILIKLVSPPTKINIGRILMGYIDASYCWGLDDGYLLLFVSQSRNLPAKLITKKRDVDKLDKSFGKLTKEVQESDREKIMQTVMSAMHEDLEFPQTEKEHLTLVSKECSFSRFLAEVFQSVVKNTKNQKTKKRLPDNSKDHYRNGWKAINSCKLAELEKVFDITTDQEVAARLLEEITYSEACMQTDGFKEFFHQRYTMMENNVYRLRVFVNCLTDGYFMDNPRELVINHLPEFNSQIYIRKALDFIIRHNWEEYDSSTSSEDKTERSKFIIMDRSEIDTAFEMLTNETETARLLENIAKDEECMKNSEINTLFHVRYDLMTNHVYKLKVLETCLKEGYFKKNSAEIISRHLPKFNNEIYLCRALIFLYLNGFREQAQPFASLLTNKKYIRQFEQTIAEPN